MRQNSPLRHQLIFRVNRAVKVVEARFGLTDLDFTARAVLNIIAEAEAECWPLHVSDVVRLQDFATPPTVHNHLAKLKKAGWIRYEQDPDDGRARLVLLTPFARSAFELMSDEVNRILKSLPRGGV